MSTALRRSSRLNPVKITSKDNERVRQRPPQMSRTSEKPSPSPPLKKAKLEVKSDEIVSVEAETLQIQPAPQSLEEPADSADNESPKISPSEKKNVNSEQQPLIENEKEIRTVVVIEENQTTSMSCTRRVLRSNSVDVSQIQNSEVPVLVVNESAHIPLPIMDQHYQQVAEPAFPEDKGNEIVSVIISPCKDINFITEIPITVDDGTISDSDSTTVPEPGVSTEANSKGSHNDVCLRQAAFFDDHLKSVLTPESLEEMLELDSNDAKRRRGKSSFEIANNPMVVAYLADERKVMESRRSDFTAGCHCFPNPDSSKFKRRRRARGPRARKDKPRILENEKVTQPDDGSGLCLSDEEQSDVRSEDNNTRSLVGYFDASPDERMDTNQTEYSTTRSNCSTDREMELSDEEVTLGDNSSFCPLITHESSTSEITLHRRGVDTIDLNVLLFEKNDVQNQNLLSDDLALSQSSDEDASTPSCSLSQANDVIKEREVKDELMENIAAIIQNEAEDNEAMPEQDVKMDEDSWSEESKKQANPAAIQDLQGSMEYHKYSVVPVSLDACDRNNFVEDDDNELNILTNIQSDESSMDSSVFMANSTGFEVDNSNISVPRGPNFAEIHPCESGESSMYSTIVPVNPMLYDIGTEPSGLSVPSGRYEDTRGDVQSDESPSSSDSRYSKHSTRIRPSPQVERSCGSVISKPSFLFDIHPSEASMDSTVATVNSIPHDINVELSRHCGQTQSEVQSDESSSSRDSRYSKHSTKIRQSPQVEKSDGSLTSEPILLNDIDPCEASMDSTVAPVNSIPYDINAEQSGLCQQMHPEVQSDESSSSSDSRYSKHSTKIRQSPQVEKSDGSVTGEPILLNDIDPFEASVDRIVTSVNPIPYDTNAELSRPCQQMHLEVQFDESSSSRDSRYLDHDLNKYEIPAAIGGIPREVQSECEESSSSDSAVSSTNPNNDMNADRTEFLEPSGPISHNVQSNSDDESSRDSLCSENPQDNEVVTSGMSGPKEYYESSSSNDSIVSNGNQRVVEVDKSNVDSRDGSEIKQPQRPHVLEIDNETLDVEALDYEG